MEKKNLRMRRLAHNSLRATMWEWVNSLLDQTLEAAGASVFPSGPKISQSDRKNSSLFKVSMLGRHYNSLFLFPVFKYIILNPKEPN